MEKPESLFDLFIENMGIYIILFLLLIIIIFLPTSTVLYKLNSIVEDTLSSCEGISEYYTGDFYYDTQIIINNSMKCFNPLDGFHPFLYYNIEDLNNCTSSIHIECGHITHFILCLAEIYDIECKQHILLSTFNETHTGVICREDNRWEKVY